MSDSIWSNGRRSRTKWIWPCKLTTGVHPLLCLEPPLLFGFLFGRTGSCRKAGLTIRQPNSGIKPIEA
ncbi:hypothetical protein GUJ93_ZPchr0003g17967 [Zizania palustris]|uniref:Uncharacterized protein n=1 Tax=Zizania palustris TaxID=103762 RepID=A0A8J5RV47_ZIZPA|nr:hypothetical protein GUJ93_ZPchr0003g17967 [Zizania palustris]